MEGGSDVWGGVIFNVCWNWNMIPVHFVEFPQLKQSCFYKKKCVAFVGIGGVDTLSVKLCEIAWLGFDIAIYCAMHEGEC